MGCSKFILFTLNFIVFVSGGIVVGLASAVISKTNHYIDLLTGGVVTVPIIILIVGIIIALIGFFGCFGALRENKCMLYTYAAIVFVLFAAQLTMGALVFIYQDEAKQEIQKAMKSSFSHYNPDQDKSLAAIIDSMQSDLHCCGVESYQDWFSILSSDDVTIGCCKKNSDIDQCYKNVRSNQDQIYTNGCFGVLVENVHGAAVGLGIAAIVLAIIQLAVIVIACGLGKRISRRGEYA